MITYPSHRIVMKNASLTVEIKNAARSLAHSSRPTISIQKDLGEGWAGTCLEAAYAKHSPGFAQLVCSFGRLRSCTDDGGNVTS